MLSPVGAHTQLTRQRNDLPSTGPTTRLVQGRGRGRGRGSTWASQFSSARDAWAVVVLHKEKSINLQGPCPGRHHHTTPDQMHETCSSHVECASCDWSTGRDKTQEATSITTALVLAGNDKIFCPHQPHQRTVSRAARLLVCPLALCPMCLPRINCASEQHADNARQHGHCNRNRNRLPDRPTDNAARGILFASLSHTPTLPPLPPSPPLGRSLRTIAAPGCRKATTQCASQKKGRSSVCKGEVVYLGTQQQWRRRWRCDSGLGHDGEDPG